MGAALVVLGVFLWFGFSMITFVFLTPWSDDLLERLRRSIRFNVSITTGPEFGVSLMQVTGIFWVITGVVINLIGESFLRGLGGDIVLGIIFLAPVWIGAIIVERRKKRRP